MTNEEFDEFLTSYIECALWSSTDNAGDSGGEPLDANYSEEDLAPATLDSMRVDCASFVASQADDLAGLDAGKCGHDFWLTRNGHGTGFWDRGLGKVGERLTQACKPYGSVDMYVGEDYLIHCN